MNNAMLLDCTLRDGAYVLHKHFGNEVIQGIIEGLMMANLDIIEIGFLQNNEFGDGKPIFLNAKEAEKFVPKNKNGKLFTVLADYSRYDINHLDPYTGNSIDAVRACFYRYERHNAIDFCKQIKNQGYKVFIQPVDILGYSDFELLELLESINEIEPYCFSIVDTFGSMYQEDLQRIYRLIDHNLTSQCKIGFHSHNNLQMSSALSQEVLQMSYGNRQVVIDATISGLGRGAGNTPTELIAEYMVRKFGYQYNIDAILDVIDNYIDNFSTKYDWGYTPSYFIAGSYSAHVNNIEYLKKKSSIRSKDVRFILNKIGSEKRKRYDYDLLEKEYTNLSSFEVDDTTFIKELKDQFIDKNVILLAPGSSIKDNEELVKQVKEEKSALVISTNFIHECSDYVFISNVKRYDY